MPAPKKSLKRQSRRNDVNDFGAKQAKLKDKIDNGDGKSKHVTTKAANITATQSTDRPTSSSSTALTDAVEKNKKFAGISDSTKNKPSKKTDSSAPALEQHENLSTNGSTTSIANGEEPHSEETSPITIAKKPNEKLKLSWTKYSTLSTYLTLFCDDNILNRLLNIAGEEKGKGKIVNYVEYVGMLELIVKEFRLDPEARKAWSSFEEADFYYDDREGYDDDPRSLFFFSIFPVFSWLCKLENDDVIKNASKNLVSSLVIAKVDLYPKDVASLMCLLRARTSPLDLSLIDICFRKLCSSNFFKELETTLNENPSIQVREFSLHYNDFNKEGHLLRFILSPHCDYIVRLSLLRCKITKPKLKELFERIKKRNTRKNPYLYLDLSGTGIGDAGTSMLIDCLNKINSLNLFYCDISPKMQDVLMQQAKKAGCMPCYVQ